MRVGEPGTDVVTINVFMKNPKNPRQTWVRGSTTVNTLTGKMATQVTIYAGMGRRPKKMGTAPVDPMTGAWAFQTNKRRLKHDVTVTSNQGGTKASNDYITPITVPTTTPYPEASPGNREHQDHRSRNQSNKEVGSKD